MPNDSGQHRDIAIIDASNVANSAPSARPRLDYLRAVLARVRGAGLDAIAVADAGLERRIDQPEAYLRLVAEGTVRVAARGEEADSLILELAREHDAIVISNDRFREWAARFPDEVARRHGFRVRDGVAEVRGLPSR